MLFNSLAFLVFITVVLLVYSQLQLREQNVFLLAASYFFYGWWDWRFTLLLLISTAASFWTGRRIHASGTQRRKKLLLFTGIAVNLGILGFFKYFNFFADSAVHVLEAIGFEPHRPVLNVILPVGISFYTFQAVSYAIDIYRGKLEPEETFVHFALYVSFFPQLVAGPIERAASLLPQISNPRRVSQEDALAGLNLVLLGCFKKIAIADTLAVQVQNVFAAPGEMTSGQLWTGVYAFTFQIYGDFSGYTDIARGVARILGFDLMENFNAPYLSRNIAEFWRRWHISLSTWLRDYLYIPLGGNRSGAGRTYFNLMATMFLAGLWHGAAWTFAAWGLLHGVYLAIHRGLLKGSKPDFAWPKTLRGRVADIARICFTFHLVALTWILFRAPDFHSALAYLKGMLRLQQLTDISAPVLFAGGLMIALDVAQTRSRSHTWLTDRRKAGALRYAVVQALFVSVLTAAIAHADTITPFIYFQF